jgi:Coenzyme PQQ synthesis protein D (PqqD)
MNADPSQRLTRSAAALSRVVDDEVLLARAGKREVDMLSGPAATAWHLLEVPTTMPALLEMLADVYSVPVADIHRDVVDLVADLMERGWLENDGSADVRP